MSLPRTKYREIVFLILYSEDMGGKQDKSIISLIRKELSVAESKIRQAWERSKLIQLKYKAIDQLIEENSHDYAQRRIPSAERNILRLGLYELLFDDEIPPKVAIDEAVRLTRKFSTPEAASFVNAVLDQVYQASEGQNNDLEASEKESTE